MYLRRFNVIKTLALCKEIKGNNQCKIVRTFATSPSGQILPEPKRPRFGVLGVFIAVFSGLFIGATISKNLANFLEEAELFVPSEDDDDDD